MCIFLLNFKVHNLQKKAIAPKSMVMGAILALRALFKINAHLAKTY
jgi:hypothetical protein